MDNIRSGERSLALMKSGLAVRVKAPAAPFFVGTPLVAQIELRGRAPTTSTARLTTASIHITAINIHFPNVEASPSILHGNDMRANAATLAPKAVARNMSN
jgi:hypothetical protein